MSGLHTRFASLNGKHPPCPDAAEAVYTRAELAGLLKVSERTLDRRVAAGKVPGVIDLGGRVVRFSKAIIDAWLAGGKGAICSGQDGGVGGETANRTPDPEN